jgi:flagellar motility protein MotE (MotC chaperone)
MSRMPRLLPLVGIAIGGVLAVKALTEAPQLYLATRALAEDVVRPDAAAPALPPNASILASNSLTNAAGRPAPAACAPTAAELAKEAGLSPAELQVLQSLSDRRGQLDQRESSLDTQVQLIAAAEAKLDARIQQMNGLKSDIQGLLGQVDQQQQAEADRLVRVYEDMPEKKAAAAMTVLDDSVRLPIAAKMKERKLAAILAQMAPADAKELTEKLAQRMAGANVVAAAQSALNPSAAPAPKAQPASQAAVPQADNAQIGQTAGPADATAQTPPKRRRVARSRAHPKAAPADAATQGATAAQTPPRTGRPVQSAVAGQPPAASAKTAVAPVAPPLPKSG